MTTNPTALMEKLTPCGDAYRQWLKDNFLIGKNWGDSTLKPALPRIAFEYAWDRGREPLLTALSMQREALVAADRYMSVADPNVMTAHKIKKALTATLNLTGDDDGK